MFKILTFTVLLGLAAAASATSITKERPRSDLTCELCTLVLTAADTLIARNETEDKIIAFIEKNLCGRLGSLNGTCTQFMETEGKQILYQLSQGIHPAVICKSIGLCNARQAEIKLTPNSLNCTICKLVITQVDNMLKNNASEAQILSFIEEHICNITGKESQLCKTIIDSYGPQILKLIANNVDPGKVCELIGMCTNSSSTASHSLKPHELFCEFTTDVLLQHFNGDYILHEVEGLLSHGCSVFGSSGPCSFFVETFTPIGLNLVAQNINPNSLCESFDFHEMVETPKNPLTCELCTLVLTAAQSLLAKNQTESQVLAFIEKELCARLGALNATCVNFLETEGRQIINDLVNGVNVSTICKKFGLCLAQRNVQIAAPKPANPLTCELCTLVLTAAQSLLAKNQTESQVLAFIEKELCARLGPLNGTCVNFLETEGRQIINDLIGGVNVSTICKKFGLCLAQKKQIIKANPLECTVCQYAIQFIDTELKGNRTEAAIVNALENVCKIVPESFRTQCDSLISTYGVYLVQLLVEFADPLKVCQAIKIC